MKPPFFVETLARNGDVLHRHQVHDLPIRLGRGYDNDYIVDDAYAADKHAIITRAEDGSLLLTDLGTRNGVVHRGKRVQTLTIDGDTIIRMGHTNLRVRSADYAVEAELVDRTMHGWEGALPGLVGLLLISVFAVFTLWVSDTQSFQPIRYLQAIAFGLGGGLVWAGVWAAGNRLFGRHARLGRHLFILGAALIALCVFKTISSIVAYALSLEFITRYSSHAAIAIACGMLYFHLTTVKPQHPKRFRATCTILFLLGSGLSLLGNEQRSGRLADDLYMSLLLPPSMHLSQDHSVAEFMGSVDALKPRLDHDRTKKVKNETEEDDD